MAPAGATRWHQLAWQHPGSWREVAQLRHTSCGRRPRAVPAAAAAAEGIGIRPTSCATLQAELYPGV